MCVGGGGGGGGGVVTRGGDPTSENSRTLRNANNF